MDGAEVSGDAFDGRFSGDVCVHRFCVTGEETCTNWEGEWFDKLLEFKGILKIRCLGGGDGLEHLIHPFTKSMGETANI